MGPMGAAGLGTTCWGPEGDAVGVMSLWCRYGVRRPHLVSRRPEAPEAECGWRGSGPPPAVKQALLSLASPVRLLIFPGLGCLPAGSC